MSGARAGADRPSPAKLRRLDEPSGKGPAAAAATRGEAARSPTPAGGRGEGRRARARGDGAGHARGGGGDPRAPPGGCPEITAGLAREGPETPGEGTAGPESTGEVPASLETTEETKGRPETINRCQGSPESTSSDCLEQKKRGLETTGEVTEGMESTGEATGDLGIAATHSLEQNKGVLKTPMESEGSLESTSKATGDLESSREGTGSLGSSNGRKGSLETAVTRCLEQGRRSKAGLETTTNVLGSTESDASPGGELKSTSRRKAKTPARPRLSAETAGSQCLERERSGNGELDTSREVLAGLEATREDTESLETTIAGYVKRDREQKGGVEFPTEPEEGPEPTACVGQSRGGPGLPDLVGVPEPAGVPVPKEHVAEESAVISLDEDEEEEEERDEGPARYLAALEAVQLELEAVEEEAARAFRRLRARFCLRRRPHLQRRNRLIQHIPGFWVTAVSLGAAFLGWGAHGNLQIRLSLTPPCPVPEPPAALGHDQRPRRGRAELHDEFAGAWRVLGGRFGVVCPPPQGNTPWPTGGGVRPEPPRVPHPLLLQRQPLFPERRRGQGVRARPLRWVLGWGVGGTPNFLQPKEGFGGSRVTPRCVVPPPRSPGVPLDPHPVVAGAGPPDSPSQGPPSPPQLLRVVWGPQLPCGGPCGRGEPSAPSSASQCSQLPPLTSPSPPLQIIKEELWPNPLQFYLLGEGAEGPPDR